VGRKKVRRSHEKVGEGCEPGRGSEMGVSM
jgi:hypothetical protein